MHPGNLLAEQVQRWKDQADEEEVAEWVGKNVPGNPELRDALDGILERLDALAQARTAFSESDRRRFAATLQDELTKLGNLERFQAVLFGSGAIAQGDGAVAAGEGAIAVGGDWSGDAILVANPDRLWQSIRQRPPAQDLRESTKRYLEYVVDRYRYLDLKGMGVSDRVPLRLPLVEVYVPLKARVEMPKGETWARGLRLAGRELPEEEMLERLGTSQLVLELLHENDGLIVLGDPGAGKTTFLKYLALELATGRGEHLNLGVRLPVLVPLSAYANVLAEGEIRLDDFIAGYFHNLGTDLPVGEMLREALAQGGALVLLDGLDEVQDAW